MQEQNSAVTQPRYKQGLLLAWIPFLLVAFPGLITPFADAFDHHTSGRRPLFGDLHKGTYFTHGLGDLTLLVLMGLLSLGVTVPLISWWTGIVLFIRAFIKGRGLSRLFSAASLRWAALAIAAYLWWWQFIWLLKINSYVSIAEVLVIALAVFVTAQAAAIFLLVPVFSSGHGTCRWFASLTISLSVLLIVSVGVCAGLNAFLLSISQMEAVAVVLSINLLRAGFAVLLILEAAAILVLVRSVAKGHVHRSLKTFVPFCYASLAAVAMGLWLGLSVKALLHDSCL